MKNYVLSERDMTPRDWLLDSLIALVALVFGCLQLSISSSSFIISDEMFRHMLGVLTTTPPPIAYFAMAITTVPLVLRRVAPWPVYLFVMAMYLLLQNSFMGYSLVMAGPVIALFTIAYERGRNEAIVATLLGIVSAWFVVTSAASESMNIFMRLLNVCYLAVAALLGYAIRTHQESVEATEQRAIAAEKSREEEAARRVEEERVRIAREIHDITAHSLSAVSIQAAAAERLVDKDPQAAKKAIQVVRSTSKSALEEIRSMIGVLRQEDGQAERNPTSGTDRMEDLVAYLRNLGLEVTYHESCYDRSQVPTFIDIALYGIAREAVTNIVRHAQAKNVHITLLLDNGQARLFVEDDGIGVAENPDQGEHHGIQGMKERAYLLNGGVVAENKMEGGFLVSVTIPLKDKPNDAL